MRTLLAAVAVSLALIAPASAKDVTLATLAPVDQSAQDPALAALIAELLAACERKDIEPFRKALSPNAVASFGGAETGVDGFIGLHGLESPDAGFWTEFPEALRLGGVFMDPVTFGAPYTYAALPEDYDPFETVIAIKRDAKLYAAPDADSRMLREVGHAILRVSLDASPAPEGWMQAEAIGMEGEVVAKGYVREEDVRSPIDYRAVFQKTENRWWLGAFVAGD
jgi:hypothetical protein